MNITEWMGKAAERAATYKRIGAPFELKDLFTGEEWSELSWGERTSFGRVFASAIRDESIPNVKMASFARNRHNQYIRTH